MPKRRATAEECVERMAAGIQAKLKKITDGLASPERGPRTGAKAEEERYYTEMQNVVTNRTWNPDNWVVTDSEILTAAKAAVPNIPAAIRRKKSKIVKKYGPALNTTYDVADEVNTEPTTTREDRIAKSSLYQRRRGEEADKAKGITVPGA